MSNKVNTTSQGARDTAGDGVLGPHPHSMHSTKLDRSEMDVRLHQSEMSTKGDDFMENDRDFPTHEGRGTEIGAFKLRS